MSRLRDRFYPESVFGGFSDVDGTVAFYVRVQALLEPGCTVLDVGCGRGAFQDDPVALKRELRTFKGKVRRVIGIDVDPAAADNPYLDEFRRLEGSRWPIDDATIDLAVSDFVIEHVEDPDGFFAELRRVVRPGGTICLRTPNARSYVGLASRLVPNRHHARVLTQVQDRRKEEDVFPTVYRCNTVGKLRRALRRHGFDAVVYGHDSEPNYLTFNGFAYWLGVLHQRFSPSFLRPTLFAFGRRDGATPDRAAG